MLPVSFNRVSFSPRILLLNPFSHGLSPLHDFRTQLPILDHSILEFFLGHQLLLRVRQLAHHLNILVVLFANLYYLRS